MKKMTLFDHNHELCKAWEIEFCDVDDKVNILCCELEELPDHDAIVTVGNSFGIMNTGIDLDMRKMFGLAIQDRVQWAIAQHYYGRLPVGQCLNIETGRAEFPMLVYASSTTEPKRIMSGDVSSVFASILLATSGYERVACCGIGSGTGGIPPNEVARMMRTSWEFVCNSGVYPKKIECA